MPTRRAYLRGLASASVLGAAGVATATHAEDKPEHVTISHDESVLADYQPLLDIPQQAREKLLGLYGWVARSSEHKTDVCVYWCAYTHQDAPWWAPTTSHYGDHEPVAVEVDSKTGEVVRVRASIYHWTKGEVTGSTATLGGAENKNPLLRVLAPFHHFTVANDESSTRQLDVGDLTKKLPAWRDNGLEDDLFVGSCYNPWSMQNEPDWWARGQWGLPSTEQIQAQVAQSADFGVVGSLE